MARGVLLLPIKTKSVIKAPQEGKISSLFCRILVPINQELESMTRLEFHTEPKFNFSSIIQKVFFYTYLFSIFVQKVHRILSF